MTTNYKLSLIALFCMLFGIVNAQNTIYVNQIGYQASKQKIAAIPFQTDSFWIVDAQTNKPVYASKVSSSTYYADAGETTSLADFSAFNKSGKFKLVAGNNKTSSPVFSIGEASMYKELAQTALKAFYLNRASMPIEEKYAGALHRPAGHPDNVVYYHPSADSAYAISKKTLSSPGGWYDAGDYNKYIVNSGITVYTLLCTYETFGDKLWAIAPGLPESDKQMPDLLHETLYNIRWMLTMQDQRDGGVYHKLTNKGFDGFIMPDKATSERYVVKKSTAAALDFAASMAQASRVYRKFLPKLADSCLTAAKAAWNWAQKNPKILFFNPSDIYTGSYSDTQLNDEFLWASIELSLSDKNTNYINTETYKNFAISMPVWLNVSALGYISVINNPLLLKNKEFLTIAQNKTKSLADSFLVLGQCNPYTLSLKRWPWGSNGDVINQAMIKVFAYRITGDTKYYNAALNDFDYLLGKNPTGYCYISGIGSKYPQDIHHRPSYADNVPGSYPGFLVGGPNLETFNDCRNDSTRNRKLPAKSYLDQMCSYSTNEIAINWNAPLVFVSASFLFTDK